MKSMKKLLTIISVAAISGSVFAGGLVTNTNQSALFTRLQSRNASVAADAVYYNPAGLTKLADGFHLSLSNQTIGQKKTVTTTYAAFETNPKDFEGTVSAPFFPSIYAAFKTGKIAVSLGFNPIGGGGGATYEDGLATFERPIADLKPMLTNLGMVTTDYTADIFFEGSSIYMGPQLNFSYAVNDMFSVAAGVRYVIAKNTYKGSIENIMINPIYMGNPTGEMMSASTFFTSISQPAYAARTADTYADAEMKGTGFTPILSVNVAPMDILNIALKYEFKTKLDLTTTVFENKTAGMFIQDSVAIADMPAMLALGVDVKPSDRLLISGSFNYYFDKGVDYDGQEDVEINKIDKNFIEAGLGIQLGLTEKLYASVGWLTTVTGVNDDYQSDMTYSLNTNTFGGGFGFRVNDMIDLNLGGSYTIYQEGTKTYDGGLLEATDVYNKNTWVAAIGIDLHF